MTGREFKDRLYDQVGRIARGLDSPRRLEMLEVLAQGERSASTSNRNFEGRQGRGGRTHLVSPMMAAAAAIAGHFTDIRNWRFE